MHFLLKIIRGPPPPFFKIKISSYANFVEEDQRCPMVWGIPISEVYSNPVSYTHLDVYKRQMYGRSNQLK